MLVMEPGGYAFSDYVKVGLPLLLLTMLVTVALVAVIYPLAGRAVLGSVEVVGATHVEEPIATGLPGQRQTGSIQRRSSTR